MSDQSGTELVMGRTEERGDVVAYLTQRIANCEAIMKTHGGSEGNDEWLNASNLRRHCQVLIDNFTAGLHVGQAEVARSVGLMLNGPVAEPQGEAEPQEKAL